MIPPWLFDPFQRVAIETVGLWYAVTVALMLVLAGLMDLAGIESPSPIDFDAPIPVQVTQVSVMAPIIEESIFRILPVALVSNPLGVILSSTLWGLLHGRAAPVILLQVPIYVKLALGGFLFEVFVLHALHNLLFLTLHHTSERIVDG